MRRLEVHPEVYEELEEARFWYEDHAAGLGTEFLDEIERAITTIQRSPEHGRFIPTEFAGFLSIAFLLLSCIGTMISRFS